MSESKLKRSPYLSQMTKTANTDVMVSFGRPDGGSDNSGGSHTEGVSIDFFELRRPAAKKRTSAGELLGFYFVSKAYLIQLLFN